MDWKASTFIIFYAITGVVTLGVSLGQDRTSSVDYIESSVFNYFRASKFTFPANTATVLRKNFDECKCRAACFTIGSACMAWTVVTFPDFTSECRLTNKGPMDNPPIEEENATYFFKEQSIAGTYSWGPDSLFYVELNQPFSFEEGKRRCSFIPGHRLIILKTMRTYNFFMDLWDEHSGEPYYTTDLMKDGSRLVWGDGTQWGDTKLTVYPEISTISEDVFINYQKKLHDASSIYHKPFRIICQANPSGINW